MAINKVKQEIKGLCRQLADATTDDSVRVDLLDIAKSPPSESLNRVKKHFLNIIKRCTIYWVPGTKSCNFKNISELYPLSEDFIREFKNSVHWDIISKNQVLSESFIDEFDYCVDWRFISAYQKLSEEFIDRRPTRVFWAEIFKFQILSQNFLRRHISSFIGDYKRYHIGAYQKVSKAFRKEFHLNVPRHNWMYTSKRWKLHQLRKRGLYCIGTDDSGQFILAYKSVRSDGRSVYMPNHFKYEVGKTYESNCNCWLKEENSFGLAAWTEMKAKQYYSDGKILLVKILIDDIGALLPNGKIRCRRLTVVKEVPRCNDNALILAC